MTLSHQRVWMRKSGLYKDTVPAMAGGGNPRDSATENKLPQQGKGEKVW